MITNFISLYLTIYNSTI